MLNGGGKKAGEIAAISPENEPSRIIRTDEKQWLQEPVVGLRRTSTKAQDAERAKLFLGGGGRQHLVFVIQHSAFGMLSVLSGGNLP